MVQPTTPRIAYSPCFPVSANLIALLKEYGNSIDGFRERVGDDFARGHKEATGGIIHRVSRFPDQGLHRLNWLLNFRTNSRNSS
jgi:hypothetical protein